MIMKSPLTFLRPAASPHWRGDPRPCSQYFNRGSDKQLRLSEKLEPEIVFVNKEWLGTSTEKIMAQASKKVGSIPKYFKRCLYIF